MESAGRILVVEDDVKLASQIERMLQRYQYEIAIEHRGDLAIERILQWQPDVVVLDLMLPGADGFDVCRAVRGGYQGKILMLTASEDDMDHVAGLETGADDYLVKPVHPRVLLAHVRLLQRHMNQSRVQTSVPVSSPPSGNTSEQTAGHDAPENRSDTLSHGAAGSANRPLQFGQLSIHPLTRHVQWQQQDVVLTPSEFDVLLLLARRAEQVVSRDEILQTLRGIEYDGFDRSVDVKVAALRKKLGDTGSQPRKLITVRSRGYLFVPDAWEDR